MTLGEKPPAVKRVLNLTRWSLENQIFHLKMTFVAHQKFATLSSKRPRAKGKMRVIGWTIAEKGANGGIKGRKRIRNVREVANASRINSERLENRRR